MPLMIGDFRRDTYDMNLDCQAMYLRLLIGLWQNDGQISSDEEDLQIMSGANKQQWLKNREKLARLFYPCEGLWMHNGIREQLKKARSVAESRSKSAKTAINARWHKSKPKENENE